MGESIAESVWDIATATVRTELNGMVTVDDVARWRNNLEAELNRVPDGGNFKLLVDLRGYEPADIDAHKAMRVVIPDVLMTYGVRPAFADLMDEPFGLTLTCHRDIQCIACANIHHDVDKMALYEKTISKPNQRFFSDREEAEGWLADVARTGFESAFGRDS